MGKTTIALLLASSALIAHPALAQDAATANEPTAQSGGIADIV